MTSVFSMTIVSWPAAARRMAAAIALTLFTSAYLAEIWRGCVESIPKGQWEASSSLALNYIEQMRYVILPQASRIAIAPTVGFSVQVVKGTALALSLPLGAGRMTRRFLPEAPGLGLVEGALHLDIPVHDHVIIGRGRYTSFAEAGLL